MGLHSFGVGDNLLALCEECTLNCTIRGEGLELFRFSCQCFLTAKGQVPPVSQGGVWQIPFLAAVRTLERRTLK